MPAVPAFDDMATWRIGTPDLIVKYPAFKMPATGPDLYGTLTDSFGTKEDRYIKAIQSRVVDADSRKVIHHALSYAVEPGDDSDMGDDAGGGSGQFLVEYASGKNATFATPDSGVLLKAGQNARVSYHFHSIGEEVADPRVLPGLQQHAGVDRKSTRLKSSHGYISDAVFCLKKKPVHHGAGAERGRDAGPVVARLAGVRGRPGRGGRGVLGLAGLQTALGGRGLLVAGAGAAL